MSPGYLTTEFWITLAGQAIALLVVFGVVPTTDAAWITKEVAALILSAGSIVAYITSRTVVKAAVVVKTVESRTSPTLPD